MILLKNDEVIDFLTSPPTDFSALNKYNIWTEWVCITIHYQARAPVCMEKGATPSQKGQQMCIAFSEHKLSYEKHTNRVFQNMMFAINQFNHDCNRNTDVDPLYWILGKARQG